MNLKVELLLPKVVAIKPSVFIQNTHLNSHLPSPNQVLVPWVEIHLEWIRLILIYPDIIKELIHSLIVHLIEGLLHSFGRYVRLGRLPRGVSWKATFFIVSVHLLCQVAEIDILSAWEHLVLVVKWVVLISRAVGLDVLAIGLHPCGSMISEGF